MKRPPSRARALAIALAPPRQDPWYTVWAIGVALLMLAASTGFSLALGGIHG